MIKQKIVVTNGCFDILHVGHIQLLQEAKEHGDILIVLVNTDESVKRLKGDSRPVNSLEDRMTMLRAIQWVDLVIPFHEDTPLKVIEDLKPDVLVKGGDYQLKDIVGADFVISRGGEVVIVPMVKGKSTTNILNKINGTTNAE
jgi:D-beta-D-heptose 7-phosphate kinase/D-beta-D-heptose 1-phosphate adenosyltransferase